MESQDISLRINEIEELVASNLLNDATKRLMDFVNDYSVEKQHRKEVIALRGTWTELRQLKRTLGNEQVHQRILAFRTQILDFLEYIYEIGKNSNSKSETQRNLFDHYPNPSLPSSKKINVSSPEDEGATKLELEKLQFIRNKLNVENSKSVVVRCSAIKKTRSHKTYEFELGPLDLALEPGQITVVQGENGSGKSTLLRIIGGRENFDDGKLLYPGLNFPNGYNQYKLLQQIAFVPQEIPEWPNTTSVSTVLQFEAAVRGIKGIDNNVEVDFIVSRLDLDRYRNSKWEELSGGYKMRFALAKSLVWSPKILILDEPLANLDVNSQTLFLRDLRDLANSKANPMTILISSQHLHKVERIADKLVFLKDGKAEFNGLYTDFGDDLEGRVFELECSLTREELLNLLEDLDYTRIESEGNQFFIFTLSHVRTHEILSRFAREQIDLKFFRDISKSTRRLFIKHTGS